MPPPPAADGPPLDTLLLRSFLEVVDSGSFAAAAERLALMRSAISGHVKRLEQSTGSRLLARTTRRLALTQAGETLYTYGRNILDLEREARARLRGARLRGRLRIGASEDFAAAWLPQVLQRFRQWHAATAIELKVGITAELLRQQQRGRLDLVFGKQCSQVADTGVLLWEEPLVWAYAVDLPLPADGPMPLALFPEPCVYRESAVAALARGERPWRIVFESSSMAACLSAARAGFAVTVIAASQCHAGLRVLGADEGLCELPAARFCAFPRDDNPASAALIDAARSAGRLQDGSLRPRSWER
ncbi:MAG: LysR substrate-binding domain-containing protein [Pseudomonas sp.]